MARQSLFGNWVRAMVKRPPSDRSDLPIVEKDEELVERVEGSSDLYSLSQLNQFRTIAQDRDTQYEIYDDMATDSVISAALEIYADDATAYDEQGRVIWVESEDEEIAKAGNRLLDIFEIPERAWKHIYLACKYGDYYLKLFRGEPNDQWDAKAEVASVKVVNDREDFKGTKYIPQYFEYVEDVPDPATVFDLRKRGKIAGFVETEGVTAASAQNNPFYSQSVTKSFRVDDVKLYKPDRFIHIMIGETLNRVKETLTLTLGDGSTVTYDVARGKSILYDVYPIQRQLQLLEDSLLVNRLTRSSLIRMLEIEVGDMPKKEVNDYLRRIKNLIEQHISLDKTTGNYQSFNAPGPIDNVIYIPTKNGRGKITINNLGGDVNIRDIADVDYFNNKRAGALKIPKQFLGEGEGDSSLGNGGSLTQMSIRYARTIKRIQTAYIRAITQLLNLYFVDKKLDYVNKFQVRMTSPSTQEDAQRIENINNNLKLVENVMDIANSLEGDTQKEILAYLLRNVVKMPEIATFVDEDGTPDEDVDIHPSIDNSGGPKLDFDFGSDMGGGPEPPDLSTSTSSETSSEPSGGTETTASETSSGGGEFTASEFAGFEDTL